MAPFWKVAIFKEWRSILLMTRRPPLAGLLRRTIADDRYPLSPRLAPLKGILAKLESPAARPEPRPPQKAYMAPRQRRRRGLGTAGRPWPLGTPPRPGCGWSYRAGIAGARSNPTSPRWPSASAPRQRFSTGSMGLSAPIAAASSWTWLSAGLSSNRLDPGQHGLHWMSWFELLRMISGLPGYSRI